MGVAEKRSSTYVHVFGRSYVALSGTKRYCAIAVISIVTVLPQFLQVTNAKN